MCIPPEVGSLCKDRTLKKRIRDHQRGKFKHQDGGFKFETIFYVRAK